MPTDQQRQRFVYLYARALDEVGAARRLSAIVARHSGLDDPLTDEPWRSQWTAKAIAALLARHGFVVERTRTC
jgi:hypothetical protein